VRPPLFRRYVPTACGGKMSRLRGYLFYRGFRPSALSGIHPKDIFKTVIGSIRNIGRLKNMCYPLHAVQAGMPMTANGDNFTPSLVLFFGLAGVFVFSVWC